jgi:hypothetical protein
MFNRPEGCRKETADRRKGDWRRIGKEACAGLRDGLVKKEEKRKRG